MCSSEREDINDLFLSCHFSTILVCIEVYKWVEVRVVFSNDVQQHFIHFGSLIGGKSSKKVNSIIWCLWNIINK